MALQRAESVLAEIVAGFRYIFANPSFRAMVAFAAVVNLFLAPLIVLIPPLVLSFAPLAAVAVTSGAAGLGVVAAGLTMAVWGGPRRRRMLGTQVTLVALAVFAVLAGLQPNLILVAVAVFGLAFCLAMMNGIFMTIVQTKLPQRIQGRMIAVITIVATVAIPVAYGVIAPYGPHVLAQISGTHRGIGLLYLCCGLALALVAAGSGWIGRLARFDAEVPDAEPDDLVGIAILSGQTVPEPVRR